MKFFRQVFLFSFSLILFFSRTQLAFATVQLDVSVVDNNLRINSCSSQLQSFMGYKGYVNDAEIFTTGLFGGFPCYSGDLFLSNLSGFLASYPKPLHFSFDFYSVRISILPFSLISICITTVLFGQPLLLLLTRMRFQMFFFCREWKPADYIGPVF